MIKNQGSDLLSDTNEPYWRDLQSRLDQIIQAGNHEQARQLLKLENPRALPRNFAASFGELAFRCQFPIFTLKVLHPFLYPENRFTKAATDREKMIYATAIFSFGAVQDALTLLNEINSELEPEVYFYKALAYVCDWNYSESVPHLQSYIQSPLTPPYRQLVGKLNLAAAYVQLEKWASAGELLLEIKTECEKGSHQLLLGNCFELWSQLEFYQGHYTEALKLLKLAKEQLINQQGRYLMLVDKGLILSQLFQSKNAGHLLALTDFQRKASQLGHWDSIRDTDLYKAIFLKDEDLARKVIMGTPSESYRQRARKQFGENIKLIGHYSWLLKPNSELGPLEESPALTENVFEFDPQEQLTDRPLLFTLFEALASDFYKPANIGFLFQKIYPDEKFNPYTSPSRVLQLLRRLDQYLLEKNTPLRVHFKKSEFQLKSISPVLIHVRRGHTISASAISIQQLKQHFDGRTFTAAKAAEALEISSSTFHRMINLGLETGAVIKSGVGRGASYRFTRKSVSRKRTQRAS